MKNKHQQTDPIIKPRGNTDDAALARATGRDAKSAAEGGNMLRRLEFRRRQHCCEDVAVGQSRQHEDWRNRGVDQNVGTF